MKNPKLYAAAALGALVSGCAGGTTAVTPTTAPLQHNAASATVPQYHVTALSSLGGFLAAGISVNQQSWVSGYSVLADNASVHATLWTASSTSATDLGTLGGSNSAVEWPNHTPGQVAGISQIASADPLGEQWSCSYPAGGGFLPYTGQECRGFVYANGAMTALGTLGGNNSFASGSNAQGQVVGCAETALHDPTCKAPQVLQFKATVWDRLGGVRVLEPLPGDSDSAATAINNRGDAVGISGICENAVGKLSAKHMVLWHAGVPLQLPSLGGSAWNTPTMISNNGEVVGFSDLAGDANGTNFNAHAFVWDAKSGTRDLGVLAGDAVSYAFGVNSRGEIVGQSCTPGCASSRAFLYANGTMYDLNALLDSASSGYDLIFANDINDAGRIAGLAVDPGGNIVAFRLTPDGTTSEQSVQAVTAVRSRASTSYHLRMGPMGRPILTR